MLPAIDFGQWISALSLSDILNVALQYLKVLAWPVTAVAAIWIFRRPVANLLTRLTEFSAFGVKSSFEDQARTNAQNAEAVKEAVEESVDHGPNPNGSRLPPKPNSGPGRDPSIPAGKADRDPSTTRSFLPAAAEDQDPTIVGLFIARWNQLERVADDVLERLDRSEGRSVEYRRFANVTKTFAALAERKIVPFKAVEIAKRTQRLRAEVVHGHRDMPLDALDDVLESIASLEDTLRAASGRLSIAGLDLDRPLSVIRDDDPIR